eukprot:6656358-Lingulodinium_polyedra.AAC.1
MERHDDRIAWQCGQSRGPVWPPVGSAGGGGAPEWGPSGGPGDAPGGHPGGGRGCGPGGNGHLVALEGEACGRPWAMDWVTLGAEVPDRLRAVSVGIDGRQTRGTL